MYKKTEQGFTFMADSKLIRHSFASTLNQQELAYREKIQPSERGYGSLEKLADGRRNIIPHLPHIKGKILELGAGSCWLSSELSKKESVDEIYSLDMSYTLLTEVAPKVMEFLQADTKKITRVVGDFNKLEFAESVFDFVMFDSALHHIPLDTFTSVFKEIDRVLKPDGKIIAIREPFLCKIPIIKQAQHIAFGVSERKFGVTENAFSYKEWACLFNQVGFDCEFIPCKDGFSVGSTMNIKNIVKKLINYTPIRHLSMSYRPSYIIVLKKNNPYVY
jgi:ubiquinone/menaquinone biosynthesis C-methylase UbiE